MAGELRAVNDALTARKDAVIEGNREGNVFELNKRTCAQLLSGFDLDPREVWKFVVAVSDKSSRYGPLMTRGAVGAVSWLDGLAMGLMIAEARSREETADV